MQKIIFFFLVISFEVPCAGQPNSLNTKNKCSEVIYRISKDWKQDSLTITGFRKSSFKELRNSIVDTIPVEILFKHLGKPAMERKFYSGITKSNYIEYIYYYWDTYTIPNEEPFERLYISFVYDKTGTFLQFIEDGMFCG